MKLFFSELQSCFEAIFIIRKVAALPTGPDYNNHYVESYKKFNERAQTSYRAWLQLLPLKWLEGLTTVSATSYRAWLPVVVVVVVVVPKPLSG